MSELIREKVKRLKRGHVCRVLDLFAGCGGLSLGFQRAGFELAGAVEHDELAARSHGLNFFGRHKEALHSKPRDITITEPEELLKEFGFTEPPQEVIDVIIGGPPCQAFARVGRAKLREIAEHPQAFKLDPRANLYLRFLEYIRRLKPLVILMENVPDVINYGGHNIPGETSEVLAELGFRAGYTILNSAFYGVPQMRERMFLLAYHKELGTDVSFPTPTNFAVLPKGYESSRQVALRHTESDLLRTNIGFIEPPKPDSSLPPAVTAKEALGDLKPITGHLEGKIRRGTRRFTEAVDYAGAAIPGSYADAMRNWTGFEANGGVCDHVIRFLPRDFAIFRRMKAGDEYPAAQAEALKMFEEEIRRRESRGESIKRGSTEYENVYAAIVPPYDPGKFPNKWRKMEPDKPARTLMAHLGKDSYSHIHFDSAQARTISVREAARLQSFPDGFRFEGTMNPAFRQIGNAVPPLLAFAIASKIQSTLKGCIHA